MTPQVVNQQSGLHLHRFNWLADEAIGALPVTWNYLEGWHSAEDCADPIAVHFTRGGPWFAEWKGVEYAAEWQRMADGLTPVFASPNDRAQRNAAVGTALVPTMAS